MPSLDENLTDLCNEASIIIFPCFTFGIFGHAATFVSLKIYDQKLVHYATESWIRLYLIMWYLKKEGRGYQACWAHYLSLWATANNTGGVGFTLSLNQSHSFFFKMGCGPSTNTRAELLALWALLVSAVSMGLPSQTMCDDSSVIKNWTNSKATLYPRKNWIWRLAFSPSRNF